jgi:hypothetical protein
VGCEDRAASIICEISFKLEWGYAAFSFFVVLWENVEEGRKSDSVGGASEHSSTWDIPIHRRHAILPSTFPQSRDSSHIDWGNLIRVTDSKSGEPLNSIENIKGSLKYLWVSYLFVKDDVREACDETPEEQSSPGKQNSPINGEKFM